MAAPSLLVFSRDPGATNSLIAILEALSRVASDDEPSGLAELRIATASTIKNLRIVTRAPGDAMWRAAGFATTIWRDSDDRSADRLFAESVGLVLTGTSDLDERGDRAIWRAARKNGIESHAVLDHPSNLPDRFVEEDGSIIWPDFLYVPDAVFAERLAAVGAPAERIRIVGELHHARLLRLAKRRKPEEVLALRESWGASSSDFVVLFVSECAREMVLTGQTVSFDEVDELESLIRRLVRGEKPGGEIVDSKKLILVIRPHPRDTAGKYDEVITRHDGAIRIAVSAEESPDLALLAADLIVGMESSLLYEAVVLGRPMVSLTGYNIAAGKSSAITSR